MKNSSLFVLVLILTLFCLLQTGFPQTGLITGKVIDSKTREPLAGVNIVVNEPGRIGTISDLQGNFLIKIPVGSYSLKASLLGYKTLVKTDVIVRSDYETWVDILLTEAVLTTGEVIVKADYFDKSITQNNLSTIILSPEEVRRSPGSSLDVQRILQGMAGVSFSSDRNNELIVRGGAPDETLVILDNMEIHSINHFPDEYNSGGAVNMINVALLQNIQFCTGGFISRYGDKLSSVMNIETRDGTRTNSFNGNINISSAGVGAILEGGINNGKGSWLISARNSFLSLIKDAIGKSAVPQYYDVQCKLVYDLSDKHTLSFSGIYGKDKIKEDNDFEDENTLKAGQIDSVSQTLEDIRQSQYAIGLTIKSLWNKNLYSLFTIYCNNYHFDLNETDYFSSLSYDAAGNLIHSHLLAKDLAYNDVHDNGEIALKGEFVWNVNSSNELNLGASLKTIRYDQNIFYGGDSSRYDINYDGWNTPDDIYVFENPSTIKSLLEFFKSYKTYFFINDKIKLLNDRLLLNLGLRYDYFNYSGNGNLSPRLSLSYSLIQDMTTINLAYGNYYQAHTLPDYSDKFNSDINRNLKNTFARHLVIGFDQILADGLKLTIEGYYKKYSDIPVPEEFIHYNDRTFRSEKYVNIGSKYSYGIDLLIQQKLVNDFFGTLAYSRMWSRYEDPRIGMSGKSYTSEYEYPDVLTVICGKRFEELRSRLDRAPFYIKYPSYILPFSDDMEISIRWRFATGRPYTPKLFVTTEQHSEAGLRWTKGSWISVDEINSERYPDYHRLDIGFNSRYNFSGWSLSIYFSIENVYNRHNVARIRYKADGQTEEVYQFSLLPVIGLEIQL